MATVQIQNYSDLVLLGVLEKLPDVVASEDASLDILVRTPQCWELMDHTGTMSRTPMVYRLENLNEWVERRGMFGAIDRGTLQPFIRSSARRPGPAPRAPSLSR